MLTLALANLTHRKVRSALSALAVAIAITLLLILVGLTNGTLNEVSARMQSVQAEIVVRDKQFDLASMSGGKLWEKEISRITDLQIDNRPAVQHVMPVFLGRMTLAGLSQNVFGVHPTDFPFFAGNRKIISGQPFQGAATPDQADNNATNNNPTLLPLIIDQRLSKAAKLKLNDTAEYGDTPAKIVAVVQTGVAGRVFAPINLLRAASGISGKTAHMFFVKADPALDNDQLQRLCEMIEQKTKRSASLVANYQQVLAEKFSTLRTFISLVSVIALIICFLFILVTIYTMVLERHKEIAILQSLGASGARVLAQTVQESLLICSLGTAVGLGLTYATRYIIQTAQPLMTVEIRPAWILIAMAIGLAGGVISAIYPAYVALKHDPVEALCFD